MALAAVLSVMGGVVASPSVASSAQPKIVDPGSGPWTYGTDMIAQDAKPNNGGATASGYSSAIGEVPEECTANPPTGETACGRGEFGSVEPFGSALLNNLDPPNSGITFGCPTSPTSNTAVAATVTGTSAKPPAVTVYPGNYSGGSGGPSVTGANVTGDTQCYSPYVTCSAPNPPNNNCSAALASNSSLGVAYEAAPSDSSTNCTGTACSARAYASAVYVAPTSPDGKKTAASACSGHVLLAGGVGANGAAGESTSAELYDPRVTVGGAANPSFNTWSSVSTGLSDGRDSMAVSILNDGRILFAGGETNQDTVGPANAVDLFDPTTCSFETGVSAMITPRYDFATAVFPSTGHVLACGGENTGSPNYTNTNLCEIFAPGTYGSGGGTWTSATAMSRVRGGLMAQTLPSGHVVVMSNNSSLTNVSEECTDSSKASAGGCDQSLADYAQDPAYGANTHDPTDASNVLVGPPPNTLPDHTSGTNGIVGSNAPTPANGGFSGLALACGGFGFSNGASLGVAPPRTCEYYVPAGTSNPPSTNNVTCSSTTGPDWCASSTPTAGAQGNIDMQRERAYFSLYEVPPCSACGTSGTDITKDRVLALGGFYGDDSSGNYLTRKNVEYLNESS
jgi:hypothetical protein